MKRFLMAAAVIVGLTAVAGCSDGPSSPTVPTLAGSAGAPSSNGSNDSTDNPNAVGGDGSAGRRSKLQAAAPAKADLISRLGEEGNLLTLASAEFINGDHSPTAE